MAKCEIKLPDEIYDALTKLADKTDEIIESTLEAGGKIVLTEAKANLNRAVGIGKYSRPTGELQSSLGLSSVKVDSKGKHNIKIGFAEPRTDGKSNAMVANILEYGENDKDIISNGLKSRICLIISLKCRLFVA